MNNIKDSVEELTNSSWAFAELRIRCTPLILKSSKAFERALEEGMKEEEAARSTPL